MQFLYPAFLFALAAIAIPILLHLFYFRRFKKVYFTNVRFLREVKEETSARSKLRNLLVMLMRIGAIAALVFVFAQPFIPLNKEIKKGTKAISIFVDNSFSMNALSEDVPLIEKAKQRAREIIGAYAIDDRFQLLTNDFEGKHQRLLSRDEALEMVEELKISPAVKELSKVLTRQKQVLNTAETPNLVNFIISDFQKNITDIQAYADTSIELSFVPLQAVQERNIAIDSAWFDAPVQMINQTNPLIVKVRNYSGEEADNLRLSFQHEGQNKPVGTIEVPANSTVTDTVNVTILRTGWHEAILSITDYPVQFDDQYYLTFNVADKINVLAVNEDQPNKNLTAAFSGISSFNLVNLPGRNLDYSALANYQLIILNGLKLISSGLAFELEQYVNNGGNLLVFPDKISDVTSWNNFFNTFPANNFQRFEDRERMVGSINTEEFIFRDVFERRIANIKLPATKGNFLTTRSSRSGEENLLSYRDGQSFLSKYKHGEGHLYVCTAPLNESYSDLVRNGEIFIPMLYKMAISSARERKVAYTIGRDEILESLHQSSSNELVYKLKNPKEEFIPQQRLIGSKVILNTNNQIREAGFYDLMQGDQQMTDKFAFNFDRKESELDYFPKAELKERAGDLVNIFDLTDNGVLTAKIQEYSKGIVLWRWFLIAALLFLLAEILLLRLWRV